MTDDIAVFFNLADETIHCTLLTNSSCTYSKQKREIFFNRIQNGFYWLKNGIN
jgi:hypothetical protein